MYLDTKIELAKASRDDLLDYCNIVANSLKGIKFEDLKESEAAIELAETLVHEGKALFQTFLCYALTIATEYKKQKRSY